MVYRRQVREWQFLASRFIGGLPMPFRHFLDLSIVARMTHLYELEHLVEEHNEAVNSSVPEGF